MAFSDIQSWAGIINESIAEKKAADKSYDEAQKNAKVIDEKEFNELDEQQIDPESLGITDSEQAADVSEKEEFDEGIDFVNYRLDGDEDNSMSAVIHQGKSMAQWEKDFKGEFTIPQLYRMASCGTDLQRFLLTITGVISLDDSEKPITEADDRDPASHLLDAVGVKASTANLTAQDTATIKLAEAIDKLNETLNKKKDESDKNDSEKDDSEKDESDKDDSEKDDSDKNDSKKKDSKKKDSNKDDSDKDNDSEKDDSEKKDSNTNDETKPVDETETVNTIDDFDTQIQSDELPVPGDMDEYYDPSDFFDMTEDPKSDQTTLDDMVSEALGDEDVIDDRDETDYEDEDEDDDSPATQDEIDSFIDTSRQNAANAAAADKDPFADTPAISKTGFGPSTSKYVNNGIISDLVAKATELVDKRDSEGLTNDEEEKLQGIIGRLRELETSDPEIWHVSSFDKEIGMPGEYYSGKIPGFNPNYTGYEKRNDKRRSDREQRKAKFANLKDHPNHPEFGKDQWSLNDWRGIVLSNFENPKQKKEFFKYLLDTAQTPGEKIYIDEIFGKKNLNHLAEFWGVSYTTVSAMETNIVNRWQTALLRCGFIDADQNKSLNHSTLVAKKKAMTALIARFYTTAEDAQLKKFIDVCNELQKHRKNTEFNKKAPAGTDPESTEEN